jgi:2-polyprenyl-6-hydroxyphenyl methylase/3-demethylubiquinone-9 3-methyltransferase
VQGDPADICFCICLCICLCFGTLELFPEWGAYTQFPSLSQVQSGFVAQSSQQIHDQGEAPSVDAAEIAQFSALAGRWWDPEGEFAALHKLNPVRLAYIRDAAIAHFGLKRDTLRPLEGLRVLDIGCGGGLLCEPLARMAAAVSGVDASDAGIEAARAHAGEVGLAIDYRHATAEALAAAGESYDIVLAMEVIEHVADVDGFIATACALVRPGGLMFAATLNRTPKSFAAAIVAAEYLLRWVPRGTHDWKKFVKPSELARSLRAGGLEVHDISGVTLDGRTGDWIKSTDPSVNYLLSAAKPAA